MNSIRRPRRRVDGVVILDKPAGLSSNAALQRVRGFFRAEKAGHTGALDPLATGVLPVCLGEATKFSSHLLDADKAYAFDVLMGQRTATGDAEGAVVEEADWSHVDAALLERTLEGFRGGGGASSDHVFGAEVPGAAAVSAGPAGY